MADKPCKKCGHCPACGRSGYGFYPVYPHWQYIPPAAPAWPNTWITSKPYYGNISISQGGGNTFSGSFSNASAQ